MGKIVIESRDGKEVNHFFIDELADLIAYARHPEVDKDPDNMGYALAKIHAEKELSASVERGEITLRNPLTFGPFDMRLGITRGVVLWDDAIGVLAAYQVELLREGADRVPQAENLQPAQPKETPAERRARLLSMFEAEEARGKRGALQRVADAEGVDRSNLGKLITKAREERDTERRAGAWTSQLVQDGKRKG